MKPGRPLAYGKIGGAHFFGLPGNPVSVMVTFYQFVRDALLHTAGSARRRAAADVQGAAVGADQKGAGTHRVPARHPRPRRRGRLDRCARPAIRARASCRRCRRRTASSSSAPTPATSQPASWSRCSCWKASCSGRYAPRPRAQRRFVTGGSSAGSASADRPGRSRSCITSWSSACAGSPSAASCTRSTTAWCCPGPRRSSSPPTSAG